jgi:hypothetical protein
VRNWLYSESQRLNSLNKLRKKNRQLLWSYWQRDAVLFSVSCGTRKTKNRDIVKERRKIRNKSWRNKDRKITRKADWWKREREPEKREETRKGMREERGIYARYEERKYRDIIYKYIRNKCLWGIWKRTEITEEEEKKKGLEKHKCVHKWKYWDNTKKGNKEWK